MKQDKWVSGEYRGAKKNPNDSDYVLSVFFFLPTTNVHQQIKAQNRKDRQKCRSEKRQILQTCEEEAKPNVFAGQFVLLSTTTASPLRMTSAGTQKVKVS